MILMSYEAYAWANDPCPLTNLFANVAVASYPVVANTFIVDPVDQFSSGTAKSNSQRIPRENHRRRDSLAFQQGYLIAEAAGKDVYQRHWAGPSGKQDAHTLAHESNRSELHVSGFLRQAKRP